MQGLHQMDRRRFVTLALGALGVPATARGQEPAKVVRLGRLTLRPEREAASSPWSLAFDNRLAELGWVEGKTLLTVRLHADDKVDRLRVVAAEMVRRKVDAMTAGAQEPVLLAARQATTSIPIFVVALDYDPVARGHVASLAKPGGNVTGMVANQLELTVKRLDLLKQTIPKLTRVAVLWDVISADQLSAAEAAAPALGLRLQPLELRNPPYDFEAPFRAALRDNADAVVPLMSPFHWRGQARIIALAKKHRLPTIAGLPDFAQDGGLISYGVDLPTMYRRLAEIADKVFRGAKPADIPMEGASKYELVINAKTAKAIGVTIPPSMQLRADQLIQ
jgi:putative ABC transport system substrate-binding protein